MKPEFENIPLVKAPQQYEIEIDGSKAFITYRESSSTITLLHTEVEPSLQGMGASTAVIEKTLAAIEESGKKLNPLCPLVVAYIKRHPEWKRIVADNVTSL
ncbi:acetyltransferase [Elizabethkingia miricola]|uniref:Acetyltransferase n=1 Tax=Elizabethkingia miricola TaxID=172045 RepID=A0ABD4DR72_ELIMR|nr:MULTISPECIES: GNAT family N-acetyltransferase [Elizabethkingia]KUY21441.1 acetyltransferase [Elizabethkingia miricola]MCL1653514.1 N-acetyltransferase [Elizabethkingia miricola]OPC70133.1 acetyltransferase [Elizabethkingia miricola]OPC74458.1 acetyltransferase [Elizabethkingia miricola]QCO45514.1 N-acetyltransferase [Elizabethkingia sp. 2-6]